jgi:hypothetical protein
MSARYEGFEQCSGSANMMTSSNVHGGLCCTTTNFKVHDAPSVSLGSMRGVY